MADMEMADMAEEEVNDDPMDIFDPYEALEEPEAVVEEPEKPQESPEEEQSEPVDETPDKTEQPAVNEFEIDLNENFYDPELVHQFKAMKSHYDVQIAELRNQLGAMNRNSELSALSRMFDATGNPDLFGNGPVDPKSIQGKNRQKVIDEMETLKAGYAAKNRVAPPDDQLLSKAINVAFGEQVAESVRRDFSNKVESRHNSRIARPNTRVSKPNNKVAEATRNVAALMRDRGMVNELDTFD